MPRDDPPARIARAVELLEVGSDDRLLEIGCGPGVAVGLVARRLDRGGILAIDRSATAIARARRRNAAHLASGRAQLRQTSLEGFEPGEQRFDTIFAINVNAFWTRRPDAELAALAAALAPGGGLRLFYETPGGGAPGRVVDAAAAALAAAGFAVTVERADPVVCIGGRVPPPAGGGVS